MLDLADCAKMHGLNEMAENYSKAASRFVEDGWSIKNRTEARTLLTLTYFFSTKYSETNREAVYLLCLKLLDSQSTQALE